MGVVGHQDVGPAVVVVVPEDDTQAAELVAVDSRRLRHVLEEAPAFVVEEEVALAKEAAGPAHHREARVETVGPRSGKGCRLEVEVHVAGHEEVQFPVAVVVAEARARGPAAGRHPRSLADVLEGAVAFVVEEDVASEEGHVEIGMAVVVVVRGRDSLAPAGEVYSGSTGDVLEATRARLAKERAAGARLRGRLQGPAVDQEHVETPVPVEVQEGRAGARGLEDVLVRVAAAVGDLEVEARRRRAVDESDGRTFCGGGRGRGRGERGRGGVRPRGGRLVARSPGSALAA